MVQIENLTDNHLKLKRKITRAFKIRGLSVQASALDAILNVLRREPARSIDTVLQNVIDEVRDKMMTISSLSTSLQLVVTEEILSEVVAEMSRDADDVTKEALQLLNALDTPRLAYNGMRKQFSLLDEEAEIDKRSIFGDAVHKVDMFLQRYLLVQQRILRQKIFRPKLVTADSRHVAEDGSVTTHKITSIESLLGGNGVRFLLGMIVQIEEGRYYLEDHTTQVPVDLSHASLLTDGFITENCIVLVEGKMIDGILYIHRMGNPIFENRIDAINAIGLQSSDIFNAMSSLSELSKMREQEIKHGKEGMFVILSDVHLDKPQVLSKLDKLFCGFVGMDPLPIFVFMGNFCSKALSVSRNGPKEIIGYYDDLAYIICKYPRIAKNGKIIFIPGPNDPGVAGVMPRPPVPVFFNGSIGSKVSHAIFASNPCRIRYFSKEIVFCRQDILDKLRHNSIINPNQSGNYKNEHTVLSDICMKNSCLVRHAVKTMLDQGHLCPLPLSSCPIYWRYDHVLRLYPPPDALVVGDHIEQYYENYGECDTVNPGPFSVNFSFLVYRPMGDMSSDDIIKSDVEFSQVD